MDTAQTPHPTIAALIAMFPLCVVVRCCVLCCVVSITSFVFVLFAVPSVCFACVYCHWTIVSLSQSPFLPNPSSPHCSEESRAIQGLARKFAEDEVAPVGVCTSPLRLHCRNAPCAHSHTPSVCPCVFVSLCLSLSPSASVSLSLSVAQPRTTTNPGSTRTRCSTRRGSWAL